MIDVYEAAFVSLAGMLGHRYPKVRSAAVDEIWVRVHEMQGRDAIREKLKGFDWVNEELKEVKARIKRILELSEGHWSKEIH
jgi:hypothetical protein